MGKRIRYLGVLTLAVAMAALCTAAEAAPRGPSPSSSAAVGSSSSVAAPVGATIIRNHAKGFRSDIARAHGFTVRRDSAGEPYGWKPGYVLLHDSDGHPFAAPTTAIPDTQDGDYAYGSCGYSFIYFNAIGGLRGFINTSYAVGQPVHEVHWVVEVSDSAGIGDVTRNFGAEPARFSYQFHTLNHAGYAEATVMPYSFIIESNGTVCYSNEPSDWTTITD